MDHNESGQLHGTTGTGSARQPRGTVIAGAIAACTGGLAIAALGIGLTIAVGTRVADVAAFAAGSGSSSSSAFAPKGVTEITGPDSHYAHPGGRGIHSYGGSGSGSGFGDVPSPQRPPAQLPPAQGPSAQSATGATDDQETGVVLINTVLGFQSAQAAGTGVVLTSDGEVLTNNHVIDGSTSISVTIASTGASYTAQVIGTDATSDVAVLQLSGATGLTPAPLDTSSTVAVGDSVTGVGNAQGSGSLSAAPGTVTALGQTITATDENGANGETLTGLIQDDADIQPGDSGGPLFDADGEVIGIDTAASSGTQSAEGYAIPIGTALDVAGQIVSGTDTDTITLGYPAFLGVEVAADPTTASGAPASGALVSGVVADGPAAAAGLVAGDTITAVDATPIDSASTLTQTLTGYAPGAQATLSWTTAAGTPQTATVTLVAGPAD